MNYGDIKISYLSPEEIAEKYGHIKPQEKEMHIKPRFGEQEPKINKDRYQEMKDEGMTDRGICQEIHTHWRTLQKWKYRWGLYK